jgi:hypothetical protein
MSSGAIAAAAAAKRKEFLLNMEEEEMTKYSPEELKDHWEFKIVRSNTGYFKDFNRLQEVINEEKRFGWIFIEKFDNFRLRFKRRVTEETDKNLSPGDDPYRSVYGMSAGKFSALVLTLTLAGTALIILIIAGLVEFFSG